MLEYVAAQMPVERNDQVNVSTKQFVALETLGFIKTRENERCM